MFLSFLSRLGLDKRLRWIYDCNMYSENEFGKRLWRKLSIYIYIYTHTHIHTHAHTHIRMPACTCTHACIYTHTLWIKDFNSFVFIFFQKFFLKFFFQKLKKKKFSRFSFSEVHCPLCERWQSISSRPQFPDFFIFMDVFFETYCRIMKYSIKNLYLFCVPLLGSTVVVIFSRS